METLQSILEALARETWNRLHDASDLSIRFGEETITDLLLLDLRRRKPLLAEIVQTSKSKESISGTDFEWWLGSDRIGWIRFAVQAKKLDFKSMRYVFTHKVNGILQIDLLERYAKANGATPIYCLYNRPTDLDEAKHWHCCQTPFERDQMGCTITPSSVVRKTLSIRGSKNFDYIHKNRRSVPWRCLALCPKVRQGLTTPTVGLPPSIITDAESLFDEEPRRYIRLPNDLGRAREIGRMVEFDDDAYDPDVGYPKRILILEFNPDEEIINR